ncbi:MAG: family 1 glycosylhydrolase, partial [Flavobacteriales bacterium]|nr:family 1 glycosylhydrolase [Flavobacteriales bacterium]
MISDDYNLNRNGFGQDFVWGVSASAYQTEGAHDTDGKGPSIWDHFAAKGKSRNKEHANDSVKFYHHYREDLALMRSMHIRNFRFSLSWPRIIP